MERNSAQSLWNGIWWKATFLSNSCNFLRKKKWYEYMLWLTGIFLYLYLNSKQSLIVPCKLWMIIFYTYFTFDIRRLAASAWFDRWVLWGIQRWWTLIWLTWHWKVRSRSDISASLQVQPYIVIIVMGSYNAQHIYPIGYSRRHCGATAALIRQPQTRPHNEEPEIRNRS